MAAGRGSEGRVCLHSYRNCSESISPSSLRHPSRTHVLRTGRLTPTLPVVRPRAQSLEISLLIFYPPFFPAPGRASSSESIMSAAHVYRRRVQFSETDMAGIVHFSNYYRYMEEAEHDWFRSLGLRIMQTLPDGRVVGWPRVRSACVYEAPARYDDDIEIRVYVA